VQCQGFATEEYDLYVVGALEPEPASEINAHLSSACDVCRNGVRSSLQFWALYGATHSPLAERPANKRLQVLPVRSRSSPTYRRWGAVAAAAAVMAGSGAWYVTRGADQHALRQLGAQLAESEAQVRELRAANQPVRQAQPEAAPRASTDSPTDLGRIGELTAQLRAKEAQLDGLRKSLGDADSRYQQTAAALTAEKANTVQIAAALAQQKDLLEKETTEQRRLTAQVQTLSASLHTAEERTRQLTAETAALMTEKARLLETVQRMEMQAGEGRRMISMLSGTGTRLVPVNGTEAAPKARGYALVSERNRVLFFANDLPPLPGGRVYQLWLIRDKSPAIVSAGVFEMQATRSAQVEFARGDLIQGLTAIAVTDEPAGGSAAPTGHKVLAGLIKS
jgi:anti-sigma-K factor RskA